VRRGIGLVALAASGFLDVPQGKQSCESNDDDQQYRDDALKDANEDAQRAQLQHCKGPKGDTEEGEEWHVVVAFRLIEKETPTAMPMALRPKV